MPSEVSNLRCSRMAHSTAQHYQGLWGEGPANLWFSLSSTKGTSATRPVPLTSWCVDDKPGEQQRHILVAKVEGHVLPPKRKKRQFHAGGNTCRILSALWCQTSCDCGDYVNTLEGLPFPASSAASHGCLLNSCSSGQCIIWKLGYQVGLFSGVCAVLTIIIIPPPCACPDGIVV